MRSSTAILSRSSIALTGIACVFLCSSYLSQGELIAENVLKNQAETPHEINVTALAPSTIEPIINPSVAIDERLWAVHALGSTLGQDEIASLYSFLKSKPARDESDVAQLHGLKNDILNVLRQQATPAIGLTQLLIEIYQDTTQDCVMRDYAIQHAVTWFEQDAPDTPDAKDRIRKLLRRAAQEPDSLAGTALLGMHRLSTTDLSFKREEIDQLALSHAVSVASDRATRITAIQVCSERGLKAVLPAIQTFPETPGSLPLRLSAIAAIGRLGNEQNGEQLQHVEARQEQSLSTAINAALKQLKKQGPLQQTY